MDESDIIIDKVDDACWLWAAWQRDFFGSRQRTLLARFIDEGLAALSRGAGGYIPAGATFSAPDKVLRVDAAISALDQPYKMIVKVHYASAAPLEAKVRYTPYRRREYLDYLGRAHSILVDQV